MGSKKCSVPGKGGNVAAPKTMQRSLVPCSFRGAAPAPPSTSPRSLGGMRFGGDVAVSEGCLLSQMGRKLSAGAVSFSCCWLRYNSSPAMEAVEHFRIGKDL